MALIALLSAKGSPGVTTTAMALTVAWPWRVILAEADPAGGDLLAGFLQGQLGAEIGLTELALADLRGRLPHEFWGQLIDLEGDRRRKLLLPGFVDPAQAPTVAAALPSLASFFTALGAAEPAYDVIVDCGRLSVPHAPWPLLHAADVIVLVVRGTLPAVSAAIPALRELRKQLPAPTIGVMVREGDVYRPEEIARRLHLPLIAALPSDRRTAAAVERGGSLRQTAPLVKAAAQAHSTLTTLIGQARSNTNQKEGARARV